MQLKREPSIRGFRLSISKIWIIVAGLPIKIVKVDGAAQMRTGAQRDDPTTRRNNRHKACC